MQLLIINKFTAFRHQHILVALCFGLILIVIKTGIFQ